MKKHDMIDIERGVKLGGARSYFLKGDGMLLEQAVLQYTLKKIVERGFTPMQVPNIVNPECLQGTGYFPGGEEDAYRMERDDQRLIGTSEIPVTAYHMNEILNEDDLPKKYCGYSACYFATACEDSHVTTIERAPHMYRNAVSNIEAMKLSDRINVRFGDANDILDSIIGDNSRDSDFDLIFIDAAKSHYREFFDRAEKLARPGASIVCDNMLIHGYLTGSTVDPGHRHRTSVKRMKEFLEYLCL